TSSIKYFCAPDPGGWSESWSSGDTVVTFSHNQIAFQTLYDFYIIDGRDIAGNDLDPDGAQNPWRFTTLGDLVAPIIISTSPADDEANVNLSTHIIVTFSEKMDTSSIDYVCSPDPGGWFVGWSNGNIVLTLLHNPFALGTTYTFQITTGKDMAGNDLTSGLIPHSWDFSTISVNSIIITPSEVSINANETVVLLAQAYDSQNNPIDDITYTWSINNDLGTITSQDLQIAAFKASSVTGTCYVNVTAGGKSASVMITIKSKDIVEEEPEDSKPEDLLWIWFLIIVIIVLFVINLWVALRKRGPEIKQSPEPVDGEDAQLEETADESQEAAQEPSPETPSEPPSKPPSEPPSEPLPPPPEDLSEEIPPPPED
ncbi:MAG: Ig-like domain-containing protein, partial [Methanomassiliicoccales archaeon]